VVGRIWDAVILVLTGMDRSERRCRALEGQLRTLVLEVTDALNMLNAWAARQAKREKREFTSRMPQDEPDEHPPTLTAPPPPMNGEQSLRARKAALRQKLLGRVTQPGTETGT